MGLAMVVTIDIKSDNTEIHASTIKKTPERLAKRDRSPEGSGLREVRGEAYGLSFCDTSNLGDEFNRPCWDRR
jgi:hypothetical protein